MKYRKAIAGIQELSVIFELEDGTYALAGVSIGCVIDHSLYPDSFLKFGGFEPPEYLPAATIEAAAKALASRDRLTPEFTEDEIRLAQAMMDKSRKEAQ